jgi:hypothetical protein
MNVILIPDNSPQSLYSMRNVTSAASFGDTESISPEPSLEKVTCCN